MDHRIIKALAEALKPAIGEAFQKAVAPLQARLDEIEARTPASGEKGERGEKGDPGEAGLPGAPGKDADIAEIERLLAELVAAELAKVPPPKDGRDGQPGVPGHNGQHGIDGKDGLGFDDLTEDYEDDGRVLVRRFLREGTVIKEFRHVTSSVLDRGVWRDQPLPFLKGDGVTWRGSFWIAQEPTSEKPGDGKTWRLAVKHGRDGKDGVLRPAAEPKPIELR